MSEQKQYLPPLFQKNEVLFGHDGTPGLIAFEVDGADKVTILLQDSLDNYQAKLKAKKRNAAAPYELALKAERPYQPGDQISYYVSGTKAKVKISENCKLASEWDPNKSDENVEHYMAKLKELCEKFRPFIEGGDTRVEELALIAED